MEKINSLVADNLKKLREERHLSLENLSKLSGVSRSMLGQIERGEANPTVATVWKITEGLKISFTELLTKPADKDIVVRVGDLCPVLADEGRYRNYPVFGYDGQRHFEMLYLELDAGAQLDAEPHPTGAREYITAFSGELLVTAGEREFLIKNGESLSFRADRPHRYRNLSAEQCRLSMVIWYPK